MGGWGSRVLENIAHFNQDRPSEDLRFAAVLERNSIGGRVIGKYGELPGSMLRPINDTSWMERDLRGVDSAVFVAHLSDSRNFDFLPAYVDAASRVSIRSIVGVIEPTVVIDGELRPNNSPDLAHCLASLRATSDELTVFPETFAREARLHLSSIPDGTNLTDDAIQAITDWHHAGVQLLTLFAASAVAKTERSLPV